MQKTYKKKLYPFPQQTYKKLENHCCSAINWDKLASFLFFTISENISLYFAPSPICLINGWVNNFLIDHLFFKSFYKHFYTKSHILYEYFCLFNLYGSFVEIKYIALRGGSLKYGGSPSTSSIKITPTDHTSTSSL